MAAQASPTQSWRIVVLRADFPLEDPDEATTSGTGQFDLRDLSQALADYRFPYETPPHDRPYFERHMEALARYYRVVSEGMIEIDYAVFPRRRDAYRLPIPALIYGNGRTPEEIGAKWVQLVQDAVSLAEADTDGPDFADYNSLVVIHAGLGRETGRLNDISSVYLSPDDVSLYGETDALAGSGSEAIRDAWILPEAIDSQGRAGLNGLIAKFFGHQLGLPGLSNFANGLPAVGGWSLMDIGANRFGFLLQSGELQPLVGFVPPHPIAWSKAQLGWMEPLVVRRDTTIALVATDRPSADHPKAVRIPISESEYFLLENRQRRATLGAPAGVDPPFGSAEEAVWISPDQVQFSDTLDFEGEGAGALGQGSGVWLGVGEYDAFIPGSGILVWHVDDSIIGAQIQAGAVNNDRVRQGIVLEEADGERDIGNLFFERQGLTEGTATDPFYAGPVPGGGEGEGNTRFGPNTLPGSESNTGVRTGIEVEVLSEPGDTMWVQISVGRIAMGWPLSFQSDGTRLQAIDLDGDGSQELLVEAGDGVWSVSAEDDEATLEEGGERLLAAVPSGGGKLFTWGRSVVTARLPATGDGGGEEIWAVPADQEPLVGLYSDKTGLYPGKGVLVLGEETGLRVLDGASGQVLRQVASDPVIGLTAADLDGDGDVEIVAAMAQGGWLLEQVGTSVLWTGIEAAMAPVSGDLDGDGRSEVVTVDRQGGVRVIGLDGVLLSVVTPAPTSVDMDMPAVLGDVDGDGLPEIVLATETEVRVYTRAGLIPAGFPAAPARFHEAGRLQASPVLADLDGDGKQEIFQATSAAGLYGFDDDGSLLEGFPLLTDGPVAISPVAGNLVGDGSEAGIQLAVLTGPLLYLWDPVKTVSGDYIGGAVAWGQPGSSAAGTNAAAANAGPGSPTPDAALLPADRAYCYPNPVGGPGDVHLRFFLSRAASLELQVFDALGERAERIEVGSQRLQAAAENEIVWSTSGYASGLYLCRLKATGEDGSKSEVVVRLAVSR